MGSKKITYGEQEQLERDWILLNKDFKNEAVAEVEKEYYDENISYYRQTMVNAVN